MTDTPETTANLSGEPIDQLLDIVDNLLGVIARLNDADTPGHWAEFTDGEAELAGAFDEDAISEDGAYAASFDNPDA